MIYISCSLMMAEFASVTQDKPKALLICSFCSKIYTDPRLLPCLHTFCKSCISSIIKKKKNADGFTCPLCQMKVPVSINGEDGFQKNLYIGRFTELRLQKSCSVCALRGLNVPFLFRCLNCLDFLCKQCSNGHLSSSFTAAHKIVSCDELIEGKCDANILQIEKIYCIKHGETEAEYYCISCKSLMCGNCAFAEHKTHELIMTKNEAQYAKAKIRNIIENGTTRMFQLKKQLNNISSMERNLEMSENQLISELNKNANYILQLIKEERNKVLEEIRKQFAKYRQECTLQSSIIESMMISTRDTINMCSSAVSQSSMINLLLLHDTLEGGVKDIQEKMAGWVTPDKHPDTLEEVDGCQESKEMMKHNSDSDQPIKLQLKVQHIDWPVLSLIGTDIQITSSYLKPAEEQPKDVQQFSGRTETDFSPLQLNVAASGTQNTCPVDESKNTALNGKMIDDSGTVNTQMLQTKSKQYDILSFQHKFNIAVKKDCFVVEIKALCLLESDRLLLLDESNRKLKCVLMDGNMRDSHQFKTNNLPSTISWVDQIIAGIAKNYMYIFTRHCDILKTVMITDAPPSEDSPFCLTSRKGEFIVGNLPDNKLISYLPSGKLKSKWKCPINVPFVSMSCNTKGQLLMCSWQKLGCVHLVEISGKEVQQFVRPLEERWQPHDACSDSSGYVYAVDSRKRDIVVFCPQGEIISICSLYDHHLCCPRYLLTYYDHLYVAGRDEVVVYKIKVPC